MCSTKHGFRVSIILTAVLAFLCVSIVQLFAQEQEEDIYQAGRHVYTEDENLQALVRIANKAPRIELSYQVVLSSSMERVLKTHAPDFKVWPVKHTHPYTRSTYKFNNARSERFGRTIQCPSAVIGDFNGDGKFDIVMDGYTKTHTTRVFLLSEGDKYKILMSKKTKYNKLPENFDSHKPTKWLSDLILIEKGQKIKSNYEGKILDLKTDAFEESTEKYSSIYYYENGKFLGYLTSD